MLRRFFPIIVLIRSCLFSTSPVRWVGLLELAFPVAVNKFIDDLLPGQDWSLILIASVALLAIYALNTAMNYVVTYWGHMLGINIETDMRKRCLIISRSSPSASSITIKPGICSVGLPMI